MAHEKYKQILSELKKQLLEAKFSASNPFPCEAAVACEKQTTRHTVHRAFIELRRLGLIEGELSVVPRGIWIEGRIGTGGGGDGGRGGARVMTVSAWTALFDPS